MTKYDMEIALEYILDIDSTIRSLAAKYDYSKTGIHKIIRNVAAMEPKLGKLIDKKAAGNHKLANARHKAAKVKKIKSSIMNPLTRVCLNTKFDKLKKLKLTPKSWAEFLWSKT